MKSWQYLVKHMARRMLQFGFKGGGYFSWLVKFFLEQGHAQTEISVLSFYNGQRELVEGILSSMGLTEVLVSSVDSMQGREVDIVILTCVRTGGTDHQRPSKSTEQEKFTQYCHESHWKRITVREWLSTRASKGWWLR